MKWNIWYNLLKRAAKQIKKSGFKPDILVLCMRGGLIPGGIIATELRVRDVRPVTIGRRGTERMFLYPKNGNIGNIRNKKILIVEDDALTGRSLTFIKSELKKRKPKEIKIVCVFKNRKTNIADYFGHEVTIFPPYPWKITKKT